MAENSTANNDSDEYIKVRKSQILYQDNGITIVRPPHHVPTTSSSDKLLESIDDHLRYLYETQKLCDLTITNGEQKLNLHRIVLAVHSDKYKEIFSDKTSPPPSEITVKDVSNEVLAKVIKYLYTGEITLTEGNVAQVTTLAFQLDLKALLEGTQRLLLKFNEENALKYLMLAQQHGFHDLKAQLVAFTQSHFETVSESLDFVNLDEENLRTILLGEEVRRRVNETAVLRAAMRWLQAQPQDRQHSSAVPVLKCLNLKEVPPQDLMEILEKNSVVADIPEVSLMLYEAYKHHALSGPSRGTKGFNQDPDMSVWKITSTSP